jgi:DNA-binding transcriptional ArsR family regulator
MDTRTTETVFFALADATRRAVLEMLGEGPAAVSALAAPHDMALPSFLRHVDVLERAGLVSTRKVGRQRIVSLEPRGLAPALDWLLARTPREAAQRDAVAQRMGAAGDAAPARLGAAQRGGGRSS